MCLHKVDEKTKIFETGWKVFCKKGNRIYPSNRTHATEGRKSFPVSKWLKDRCEKTLSLRLPNKAYRTGFHYFRSKVAAHRNSGSRGIVRKVRVRNVVASGTQWGYVVGVAREIFIEPND